MIIDFHTHAFPDSLADRAIASLRKTVAGCGLGLEDTAFSDGTVSGLIRTMDRGGIDRAVLLPVATKSSQAEGINRWTADFLRADSRIIPFGAVYPCDDYESQLEKIAAAGYKGVKIHGDYQNFYVDEPRMIRFYRKCAELSLTVVQHGGADSVSPRNIHVTPEGIARVLDRITGVTMVIAHMGGIFCQQQAARLIAGAEGLYFDTSYTVGQLSPEEMGELIHAYGADKVLFGSDCPWNDPANVVRLINQCGLSEKEKQLIFCKNSLKISGENS